MSAHPFQSLFDDCSLWQVFASGQAEGRLSRAEALDGTPGLRLDYDFHEGGGFVAVRRPVCLTLPASFTIGFALGGEGQPNHFEFKVAAPGGANVWRYARQKAAPPASWCEHRVTERELLFAWGPAGGGAPSVLEAVEFVVAAGPGGKGSLLIARPSFEDQTLHAPAAVRASSAQPGGDPEAVFNNQSPSVWRAAADDPAPRWEVDFGKAHRFGGLVIRWPEELPARAFQVDLSDDASSWRPLSRATSVCGRLTHVAAPGAEARHLRLIFAKAECAALRAVELRPDAFSSTPNAFIHAVASDFPRGWFPRYWLREQSYWTPVGSPEGRRRALINEEGLVEVDEAGFSLEPFVVTPDGPVTWADVTPATSLPAGGAPLPSVTWRSPRIRLDIHPWVDGEGDDLTLRVTYRLSCRTPAPQTRLVVAVRPFQVNPPWQAFRNLGGRSPIHRIRCGSGRLVVEGRTVTAAPPPDALGATAFEEGEAPSALAGGSRPRHPGVDDPSGLASAEMAWAVPADEPALEVTVSVPYFKNTRPPRARGRANALSRWRRKLAAVEWAVPPCAAPAFDCFRTAAGHILINRDGPAIQPGPRRYTRSWVRDCVLMGAALAKAGLPESLKTFLTWYAPFQREDGFIPCVVDRDGVDWLVEHDSHGQFIWGVREVLRGGADSEFLKRMLPHLRKAADFLIALRAERRTDHFRTAERAACFGLLPESASHEGYLAHPVHAYWDDFWGIRGLEAAADLAGAAGLKEEAARWRAEAASFQSDLLRSIGSVIADKRLCYIPGSVEWADFDPTATANAVALLDFADALPAEPLRAMLDTYLDGFRRKHRGEMPWVNYTAYEIRIIGAFVRLGRRDAAHELLAFFLSDRRPRAWNQWPEITWRDPRAPGHLGDVPHTWIAAEYLLALASMVAAEREASASLVLASGLPWAWIADAEGFAVSGLPTRYGPLDFAIRASGTDTIRVRIGDSLALPAGGLTVAPPLPEGKKIVGVTTCQGSCAPLAPAATAVAVTGLPFEAELRLG